MVRLTEGMMRDPKIHTVGVKYIDQYKISIIKSKAWFHKYTDWKIEILDTKSKSILLDSSYNEQYIKSKDVAFGLKKIKSIKDLKEVLKNDSILWTK